MFVQRLVRLDRLSEVHVQSVIKLQLEVRPRCSRRRSGTVNPPLLFPLVSCRGVVSSNPCCLDAMRPFSVLSPTSTEVEVVGAVLLKLR